MSPQNFSLELYVVTDNQLAPPSSLPQIILGAIQGGATIIQYREKNLSTRAMIEQARGLLEICKRTKTPLIINDRIDVAMAIHADGVHLGQDDMLASDARGILGPNAIIGVSVRSAREAEKALEDQADYVAANGIWDTQTKTDHGAALGLDALRSLVLASRLPLVAIGGINKENAAKVAETGAKGIAVVSAVMTAPSPRDASLELIKAFRSGIGEQHY